MASGTVRITFRDHGGPIQEKWFHFAIDRSDGESTNLYVSPQLGSRLLQHFQQQDLTLTQFARFDLALDAALLKFGLRWLEGALATDEGFESLLAATKGVSPGAGRSLNIHDGHADQLLRLVSEKECAYHLRVGRELYCAASDEQDPFRMAERRDGRVIAPTTIPICGRCQVPDGGLACGDLVHARVHGAGQAERGGMYGTGYDRRVAGVLCARGRPEVGTGTMCVPGGNGCWSRTVRPRDNRPRSQAAPLSLPAALDFLDTEFRVAFGRTNRLIHPGTWETPAGLAQPVVSLEDLESRMSDLADALDHMRVPDGLLDAASGSQQGSLNQVGAFLATKLDGDGHAQAMEAIRTLQKIRRLRATQQHAGALEERAKKLEELGLGDLAFDAPRLWDEIRALAVEALLNLRSSIHRYEPPTEEAMKPMQTRLESNRPGPVRTPKPAPAPAPTNNPGTKSPGKPTKPR